MTSNSKSPDSESSDAPLTNFSHCHDGIIAHLVAMGKLPELAAAAEQARILADDTRNFFRKVIFDHHEEEERVLFEAVLASAREGEERDHVKSITDRLTHEHRKLEAMWAQLEPHLKKIAKGQAGDLDASAVQTLVREYRAHAAFEEAEFLPLSQTILSRNSNHMAALGLSLHIRHVTPTPSHM